MYLFITCKNWSCIQLENLGTAAGLSCKHPLIKPQQDIKLRKIPKKPELLQKNKQKIVLQCPDISNSNISPVT